MNRRRALIRCVLPPVRPGEEPSFTVVVYACRGRYWQAHSRNHGAACADGWREYVQAGGLAYYGPNVQERIDEKFRRAKRVSPPSDSSE
jgi:hypothetical protein